MSSQVQVNYRKYDGTLHWNLRMRRLGEDEHGVWLGLPADSVMRKGHGPEVPIECAHVALFPRGTWWTAVFNAPPRSTEVYCDITTPVEWVSPDEVDHGRPGPGCAPEAVRGATLLVDEDEFAEHQVRYGYPADVIAQAEAAGRWLMEAVGGGAEPFGKAYRPWLAMVADGSGA